MPTSLIAFFAGIVLAALVFGALVVCTIVQGLADLRVGLGIALTGIVGSLVAILGSWVHASVPTKEEVKSTVNAVVQEHNKQTE